MKMKRMRKPISLLKLGIINFVIHFPALIATAFWGLLIIWVFDLWNSASRSPLWDVILFLPIFIPLISCIAGIVRGAIHFKNDKYAPFCLIFSTIGIFLYAGMMFLCGWLGSIG